MDELLHELEHSDGRVDELLHKAATAIRELLKQNQVLYNSLLEAQGKQAA